MRLATVALVCAALLMAAAASEAKVIAEGPMRGGGTVRLHDITGPCFGSARLVEYIDPQGEITPGCWVVAGPGVIGFVLLDGQSAGAIPSAALTEPKQL